MAVEDGAGPADPKDTGGDQIRDNLVPSELEAEILAQLHAQELDAMSEPITEPMAQEPVEEPAADFETIAAITSWQEIASLPVENLAGVRHTEEYGHAVELLDALDDCDCTAGDQNDILSELHRTVLAMIAYVRGLRDDMSERRSKTPWNNFTWDSGDHDANRFPPDEPIN